MHVHPIRNKTSLELWPLNIGNINISIGGGAQNICTYELENNNSGLFSLATLYILQYKFLLAVGKLQRTPFFLGKLYNGA